MAKKFAIPRGTADILPPEIDIWQYIEQESRKILELYGYREIRTPAFEETELFARSMGQTSDVVQKQMLNIAPQKEGEASKLALRPECTASVVRSYIQNGLDRIESLSKLYYVGPMFRGERPQKGRLRQFYQIGVEAIGPGSSSPYLDAEVIALSVNIIKALGIKGFKLKINTLGSPKDKEAFSKHLRDQIKPHLSKLSAESQDRFERNVFRILDSKDEKDKKVVGSIDIGHDYLSKESLDYYTQVKDALSQLDVEFEEDLNLVRGLDYYTHTVFEISAPSLGAQDALGAGGRYNGLVRQLGGGDIDAVGFALGVERMILALEETNHIKPQNISAYIVALDDVAQKEAFTLLNQLRSEGIAADMSYRVASMKNLMKNANKSGAQYALILGDEEIKNSEVTIKNMETGDQEKVSTSQVAQFFKN